MSAFSRLSTFHYTIRCSPTCSKPSCLWFQLSVLNHWTQNTVLCVREHRDVRSQAKRCCNNVFFEYCYFCRAPVLVGCCCVLARLNLNDPMTMTWPGYFDSVQTAECRIKDESWMCSQWIWTSNALTICSNVKTMAVMCFLNVFTRFVICAVLLSGAKLLSCLITSLVHVLQSSYLTHTSIAMLCQ